MKSFKFGLLFVISFLLFPPCYSAEVVLSSSDVVLDSPKKVLVNQVDFTSFKHDAQLIRTTYEAKLFTLPAFKFGHYGLRMYRQTLDKKYGAAIWADMARIASRLNKFASEVYTPEQIKLYSMSRIHSYLDATSERSKLRYQATQAMPEYLYLGVALLGAMARADEYGLKHLEDKKFRQVIRRYDFRKYATNESLIKAWAAQLANQVFWLRQLGEQDVVDEFIAAFRKTYPDSNDSQLSVQQYGNKIYGLTHIILAASSYYQCPVNELDFQWIFDYYRNNINTIIARAKEDVIAEVGINFLLAGLDNDPVVLQTRKKIQKALNREHGLLPSVTGSLDLNGGEHRNVLAIMLLDWKGTHAAPIINKQPEIFSSIPYGLIAK